MLDTLGHLHNILHINKKRACRNWKLCFILFQHLTEDHGQVSVFIEKRKNPPKIIMNQVNYIMRKKSEDMYTDTLLHSVVIGGALFLKKY